MKVYNTKKIENFESSINSIANNLEIALDYNPLSKNCYRIKLKKVCLKKFLQMRLKLVIF